MVYQKLQSIPRDAFAIAELILRELPAKSAAQRRRHGGDYQIRASHQVVPGNVQDAMMVVRNDVIHAGDFGSGRGQEIFHWGDLYMSEGLTRAILQLPHLVLGDYPHHVQTNNEIPHTYLPKCILESDHTVNETRSQHKKADVLNHRAYKFLQKERENDKGPARRSTWQIVATRLI